MLYTKGNNLKVILVDDLADELARSISSKIEGAYISSLYLSKFFVDALQKKEYQIGNKELWCFDASYKSKDLDISALDVAELLISWFPEKADSIVVFVGADINNYYQQLAGNGDYDAKVFLSRIRALPHVIYGGTSQKTKEKAIICAIRSSAKKNNIEIEDRMKKGDVSPEVLLAAKETMSDLNKIKEVLLSIALRKNNNLKPTSEEERILINVIKTTDQYVCQQMHDISNILTILSLNMIDDKPLNKRSGEEKQK